MLNKAFTALICVLMLAVVFGCGNQKKETEEKPAEQTQDAEKTEQAEQPETAETAEQTQDAEVAVEEISLSVEGMT